MQDESFLKAEEQRLLLVARQASIFGLVYVPVNVALRRAGLRSFFQQLPWRILHMGLAAGAGYAVFRGYQRVFADDEPAPGLFPAAAVPRTFVPLMNGRF